MHNQPCNSVGFLKQFWSVELQDQTGCVHIISCFPIERQLQLVQLPVIIPRKEGELKISHF